MDVGPTHVPWPYTPNLPKYRVVRDYTPLPLEQHAEEARRVRTERDRLSGLTRWVYSIKAGALAGIKTEFSKQKID